MSNFFIPNLNATVERAIKKKDRKWGRQLATNLERQALRLRAEYGKTRSDSHDDMVEPVTRPKAVAIEQHDYLPDGAGKCKECEELFTGQHHNAWRKKQGIA